MIFFSHDNMYKKIQAEKNVFLRQLIKKWPYE